MGGKGRVKEKSLPTNYAPCALPHPSLSIPFLELGEWGKEKMAGVSSILYPSQRLLAVHSPAQCHFSRKLLAMHVVSFHSLS